MSGDRQLSRIDRLPFPLAKINKNDVVNVSSHQTTESFDNSTLYLPKNMPVLRKVIDNFDTNIKDYRKLEWIISWNINFALMIV